MAVLAVHTSLLAWPCYAYTSWVHPHPRLLACPEPPLRRSKVKGDLREGIIARMEARMCSQRTQTVQQLRALVEEKGFVLLKAPPRSGKTSLLQLLDLTHPKVRRQW